ncbi:HEAT repeat domain-containing protein [candidate division WOR-3 bacterium]|nr:HEAT repeat domain-containing protein [candidate division WOR-3 bacterium]
MKCPYCKHEIANDWLYCGNCGINIKKENQAKKIIQSGLEFEHQFEYTKASNEYKKALELGVPDKEILELLEKVTRKEQAIINWMEKGKEFLSSREWKEAIRAYENVLKLKPVDGYVKTNLLLAKRNLARSHKRIGIRITVIVIIIGIGTFGWYSYTQTPKQVAQKTLKQGVLSQDLLAKQYAIEALGGLKDKRFFPLLKDALKDKNPAIRTTTAKALGEFGDSAAIPFLKESLFDKEWQVRYAAAQSLALMGDTSGIQLLKQALKR